MRWIKHMTATRRDEKVARLIVKHGMAAYGLYWSIQELIAEQMEGGKPSCSVSYPVSMWSHQLSIYPPAVEKQLRWMADAGLMEVSRVADELVVTNVKLLKYRDEYSRKSGHAPDKLPSNSGRDTEADIEQKQIQKEQKPSAKVKPSADPRFSIFKHDFETAYTHINHIPAPWDAKEATNLKRWLAKNPTITQEHWHSILRNRKVSPINQKAELSRWISTALSWLDAPADEWGKPINANGHGGGKFLGKGESTIDALRQCLAENTNGSGTDGDATWDEAGQRDSLALFKTVN